ncbi:MAG TPA: cysteine hydrolase [Xanthobacteraceae bacterium]|nr:cysteine hydrolase [Xanthobacteraceae bacterium]
MTKGRTMTAVAAMLLAVVAALTGPSVTPAASETIVDKWASVPAPPPPTLKPVTVDPKTTALLMLDFMSQNCGKRPTCIASLPTMKKLLADARAAKVPVVYSIIANSTTADVMPDVVPLPDEPWVQAGPDKFLNTDLAKILKDKGIQSVIVTGTASNGAVLFTAAGAAFRGLNVIVPVDGMSAVDPYADLSTAYTLLNAPSLSAKSTLTRADMIKF